MRFLPILIAALFLFVLYTAPASAQCRAGACRAQFGQRAQARREVRQNGKRPVARVLPWNWRK